ncbi:MAG: hypothetical protein F9K19_22270 [Rhizobiaceae bacterium]|nr:MAG: hypothetical protein F9K19_22270 [Rhizobiaceae bacterium]CAG0975612.1 hypothetical protein RHIZO_01461 [Rhizobiaceae bacterium]
MEGALQDRRTFRGIAATLLVLALLAERAAVRSFPVRFVVLAILWRAEAIARAFVVKATGIDGLGERPPLRGCAIDAGILALRLRMLAAVLGALAGAAGRPAGKEDGPGDAPRLPVLLVVRLPRPRRSSWLRGRHGLRLAIAAPP